MRAGGAEQEMQLSEMGELVLSTGDGDAAAASGPVPMEGEPAGLIQARPCQEFPSATAEVA